MKHLDGGRKGGVAAGLAALLASLAGSGPALADQALIDDALAAAAPGLAEGAKVVDWEGTVLKEGANGYTCLPTPPTLEGTAPMCLDEAWMHWAMAWQHKQPITVDALGIAYMLAGDEGASLVDPYAQAPTGDNAWVEEGPHLMLIAPAALLEGYSSDPHGGGPYLMWQGTDYQHLMVPVGPRD
ncbi:hypothetical protein [Halomonas denitrificans]|uniref:hypothetical protein n=1 Tax=Halomonas denitrificans TaxID=370769 RepID=UPI001B85CE04|nr:hypothetical protein [Halomonas denitrificans]